jgi:bis(5'-nucleosidyl)-tetraphosphatase
LKKNKIKAAGIVVIRYFGTEPKILCLRDGDSFDLPKGKIEPGEDIISAALRETEEESGVVELKFLWGLKTLEIPKVIMFIAATKDDPIVLPNPTTGELEHQGASWLSFKEALSLLQPNLRLCVPWAMKTVGETNVCF